MQFSVQIKREKINNYGGVFGSILSNNSGGADSLLRPHPPSADPMNYEDGNYVKKVHTRIHCTLYTVHWPVCLSPDVVVFT